MLFGHSDPRRWDHNIFLKCQQSVSYDAVSHQNILHSYLSENIKTHMFFLDVHVCVIQHSPFMAYSMGLNKLFTLEEYKELVKILSITYSAAQTVV